MPDIIGEARPPAEAIEVKGGVYFRSVVLDKGETVPQHVHSEPHATYVGAGAVRVWIDGECAGDVEAGHAIEVGAGRKHFYQALQDETRLVCVWPVDVALKMGI